MRPTPALKRIKGKPVIPASVTMGMAMEPNATGAVLASRQMAAAWNGEKPSPASMAAATATGVPNPAAPSRNAPKANAMRSVCNRGSRVRLRRECLMASNLPVSSVRR